MALDDIFIDEEDDENKLPELVRLRNKRGWSQYQITLAVNLNIKVPDFKPEQEYVFMLKNRNKEIDVKSKMIRHLIFVSPCKGAHNITHYLFKHKCGYLECFTQVQLMDYKIEDV